MQRPPPSVLRTWQSIQSIPPATILKLKWSMLLLVLRLPLKVRVWVISLTESVQTEHATYSE